MRSTIRIFLATLTVATLTAAQDVAKLAASARTAGDHKTVADLYRSDAKKHEREAARLRDLAARGSGNLLPNESKHPMAPGTRGHSQHFAAKAEQKAKKANDLAAHHQRLAERAQEVNVE